MTHKERTAIVRILRDLIKADAIIDSDEIQKYTQLRHRYKITRDEEVASVTMPLADAVGVLAKSRQVFRQTFLRFFLLAYGALFFLPRFFWFYLS